MCEAVEVFGPGNVQPSFVSGVEMARPHGFQTVDEAVKSSSGGFEYLMSHGILPRPQQWRREPSTALCREAEQSPVPLEFYIQSTRDWYELYQKYRAKLPRFGGRDPGLLPERSLLGPVHGAYGDYVFAERASASGRHRRADQSAQRTIRESWGRRKCFMTCQP